MKDLKHIKRFNESDENLNISDVSSSSSFTKGDLQRAFSNGVQIGADYGEDGKNSVYDDFNEWFNIEFGNE